MRQAVELCPEPQDHEGELRVEGCYVMTAVILQETLLSSDTSFTVRAVIQLYMNILLRQTETGRHEAELQYSDVLTTTRSDQGSSS